MTQKEVRNLITSLYLTAFTGQWPIAIDNKQFDTPDLPQAWVRVNVIFNDGAQSSLGRKTNRKFEYSGLVIVQIFTAKGKGTDESDEMADVSLRLLDGEHLQDLWLYNGRIDTQPAGKEYYQQNVSVEFTFQEVR